MVLESVDLGDLWYSVFLDLGDLLWAVCRSASFSCVSSREVYQVWQEWMLGVCLVNWTKVAPLYLSTVVPAIDMQAQFILQRTLGIWTDDFVLKSCEMTD